MKTRAMVESDKHSDGELLSAVASRAAQDCFAELVRRHGPMVLGVCHRQLGDRHDAEDAAQAVFLVLWQKADSLGRRASVAGWLHHVARNVCRNAKRARSVRMRHECEAARKADACREQHREGWDRIRDFLDDELDALPEKYRTPVVLFHLEGRSLEETGELLRMKTSTLTTRLHRGRNMLRKRLARRGITVSTPALAGLLTSNVTTMAMPLFFAETTAKAANLHALGQAGGLVSAQSAALMKGALNMLMMAKVKMVVAVVLASILILGTGSILVWQMAASATHARAPAPRELIEPAPVGGTPVDGLRLTLQGDRKETVLLPDAPNAQAVKFTVTFTNVGDRPLKLDTWDLPQDGDKLKIAVTGPEGGVEFEDIRPRIQRLREPRKPADFPTLAQSGTHHLHFSSHGIDQYCQIRLRKPGTYRFRVVYQTSDQNYPEDFAKGSWTGSVASNEFVLTVRPPAEPAEIGGKPVDGLRLALIANKQVLADRDEVRLLPDASNAQEVKLFLTFTNVGKTPLKLDLWDLGFDEKLTVRVTGPEGGVEVRDIRRVIDRQIPARDPADFLTLAPSGMHYFHFSSHGGNTYCAIRLRKPGTYRFKVVYRPVDQQYPEAFAKGYWTGTVASNEFVLTVRPPAEPDSAEDEPEPVRILEGRPVESVSFTPDGKAIISWDKEFNLKRWTIATGKAVALPGRLPGKPIAVAPDGKSLVVADRGNRVMIWDLESGKVSAELRGHTTRVGTAVFSRDGKVLATASDPGLVGEVKVWDVTTFREHKPAIELPVGLVGAFRDACPVRGMAISPDGKTLAVASPSFGAIPDRVWQVRVWNIPTARLISSLDVTDLMAQTLFFTLDGKTLGWAVGYFDAPGFLQFWDIGAAKPRQAAAGHPKRILTTTASPDGKLVAAGGEDGMVKLWDVESLKERASFAPRQNGNAIRSLAFSPDGKQLAVVPLEDPRIILGDVTQLLGRTNALHGQGK